MNALTNKDYLGRTVTPKKPVGKLKMGRKYLVVGYSNNCIIVHSTNISAHNADGHDDVRTFLTNYETPEKRGKHCWCISRSFVKIINDFQEVFNKIERDTNG